MNARKIREDLGRAKASANKKELERALYLILVSLKDLGGQQTPMDLRGDFREAINATTSLGEFKEFHNAQVVYQAGKEKDIFRIFARVYKQLRGQDEQEESYEQAMQRKMMLDRCLKEAKSALARGKISDADALFTQALVHYRDETILFAMIARELMAANEVVRALGYIKRGLKELPEDHDLLDLANECNRLRMELGR